MGSFSVAKAAAFCVIAFFMQQTCVAQTIVDSDFSRGNFAALGWKVTGAWDVSRYPVEGATNPGPVARFAANKPTGSLSKTFKEVKNPKTLSLSLDYGWGWGSADQGPDAVSFMLLDSGGNRYIFEIHRCKATWAVQWAKVADGAPCQGQNLGRLREIDASHASVRDGGGLSHLTITRDSDGAWSVASNDWNKGAGATMRFNDATTASFSQIVLLGTANFDEQLYNKIVFSIAGTEPVMTTAIPAVEFLDSIGINSTFPDRGQPLPKTIEMIKYTGFRWVRGGIEGLTDGGSTSVPEPISTCTARLASVSVGDSSAEAPDLTKLIATARPLAEAGAPCWPSRATMSPTTGA